jgi:thiol-disulfide isomerase/thioredoxin
MIIRRIFFSSIFICVGVISISEASIIAAAFLITEKTHLFSSTSTKTDKSTSTSTSTNKETRRTPCLHFRRQRGVSHPRIYDALQWKITSHKKNISHSNDLQLKLEQEPGRRLTVMSAKRQSSFKNFEEFLVQQQKSCNEQTNVNKNNKPLAVVTFSSPFCGPCVKMKGELMKVKGVLNEHILMVTIDSDKYPSLSCRYNIKGG